MILVSTAAQSDLMVRQACRWWRPIWVQPGATYAIENGQEVPLSRRGMLLARPSIVVFRGRVVLECGEEVDPYPGASDLEVPGPSFSYLLRVQLDGGTLQSVWLKPGTRAVRIRKVVPALWSVATTELYVDVRLNTYNQGTTFSGSLGGRAPMDSDGFSPAFGSQALTVQAYQTVSGATSPANAIGRIIAPPSSTHLQPNGVDFGSHGPVLYPAAGRDGSLLQLIVNSGGTGDFLDVFVYGHEEFF